MDVLSATLLAAAIAWASIVGVIHLPQLPAKEMRLVASVTIALLGLMVLGVPVPGFVPVLTMIGGALLVLLKPRDAAAAA